MSAALSMVEEPVAPLRLDIGCGPNKKAGFFGIDAIAFEGVDAIVDVAKEGRWRFVENQKIPGLVEHTTAYDRCWHLPSDSVDEVHCSHFLEHLDQLQRCNFMNELHRVLKKDAKATIIVPHWASNRAYGDPTHKWPAISEMFFWYLDRGWRAANAPHTDRKNWRDGYDCDFGFVVGYGMHPTLAARNPEYQQYAMQWMKEAIQDTHATLIKR